jgi:hypothetical protein
MVGERGFEPPAPTSRKIGPPSKYLFLFVPASPKRKRIATGYTYFHQQSHQQNFPLTAPSLMGFCCRPARQLVATGRAGRRRPSATMGHNPPRYDPARHGPVDTVWMAHMSKRTLWAFCRNCGHTSTVDTWALCQKCRSGDTSLAEAARRFSCRNCRHRVTMLIPADGLAHS